MITGVDHIVLNVADVDRSVDWYRKHFGFDVERYDLWREGRSRFVSLRVSPTFIIDLLPAGLTGVNVDHFALVADATTFDRFVEQWATEIEMGPAALSGAQGTGDGAYVRDPDGHRVELRTYRPTVR